MTPFAMGNKKGLFAGAEHWATARAKGFPRAATHWRDEVTAPNRQCALVGKTTSPIHCKDFALCLPYLTRMDHAGNETDSECCIFFPPDDLRLRCCGHG